jgi:hypothetical protein
MDPLGGACFVFHTSAVATNEPLRGALCEYASNYRHHVSQHLSTEHPLGIGEYLVTTTACFSYDVYDGCWG